MKVNSINVQQPMNKKKTNPKLKAARDGAIITSGLITASTGISWLTHKEEMKQVVKEFGGKGKYTANFVVGLAILSAAGALVNTAVTTVLDKIKSKKPPKAAN